MLAPVALLPLQLGSSRRPMDLIALPVVVLAIGTPAFLGTYLAFLAVTKVAMRPTDEA